MIEWMILPLKRYAEFSGRSRRMEYWGFALLNILVVLIFVALMLGIGAPLMTMEENPAAMATLGGGFWIILVLFGVYFLAVLVPSIAVTVRRLHDRNLSGWWYLGYFVASMIPLVNFVAGIALLVVLVMPGTPGLNKYGPDPKDPGSADVFA